MKKIDGVIWRESRYVALWVLILSILMQAVFLVLSRWDYTVLLGNLLTAFFAVLNFFLMGLGVQASLGKEEKEAKSLMKLSMTYRYLLLAVVVALGILLPCFHTVAVVVPVFFPRVAVLFRPLFDKKRGVNE
ncbi:MAG: hypothetical protein IJW71_01035 [Clostridia bacterium]|nr:hypothetical protein [Clostridia bacterium]